MTNKKSDRDKLEFTIKIDATLMADFDEMLVELNKDCSCGITHTLENWAEENMKSVLRQHHMYKALRRYL